jgi:hypothetical protein
LSVNLLSKGGLAELYRHPWTLLGVVLITSADDRIAGFSSSWQSKAVTDDRPEIILKIFDSEDLS